MFPRLAAFGAIVLWGISFVATKAALQEISPITLIFTRFAMGTAILVFILKIQGQSPIPPTAAVPSLAVMGFIGIFVHQMLQANALTMTTAVRTGWLIGLTPIWSAALSAIFLQEKFGSRKVLGLILGTIGAITVVARREMSSAVLALPATMGDLLILASTVNWAIYTILGRETLKRLGSTKATAAAMFAGWAMLIPFYVQGSGWREYAALSATGAGAVLFLGIGCSGLGYWFWNAALEQLEAAQVAAFL